MAKKLSKIILTFLVLILIAIWVEIAKSPSDNAVHLYFFSVGQGDSELIQKGDFQVLIDGGPDDSVLSQIGRVMPLSDRKIEILILTHPHADHLIGLNQIIERYDIGRVYFNGVVYTSNQYLEFLQKLKDKKIETVVPDVNRTDIPFENASLTFLWPGNKYSSQSADNLNNTSLVSRFCYFEQCALFLGDLETDGQMEMFAANKKADYRSTIIKIAHHGSSNGTNQNTLDQIGPEYAVIEVGADNQYGHPHAVTLDLLQMANIKTLRTDRDGIVEFLLSETVPVLKK